MSKNITQKKMVEFIFDSFLLNKCYPLKAKGGITELSRPGFSKTLGSLSIKLGFKNTEMGLMFNVIKH